MVNEKVHPYKLGVGKNSSKKTSGEGEEERT
jgi:hypothetical protein